MSNDLNQFTPAERPSADEYFMLMAHVASLRGTCLRRKVGCILVDENRFVLSTGYNGGVPQALHCIDTPCPGASLASGEGLDLCEAIHAEQNALLQCKDTQVIHTAFCTTSPCMTCVKLLAQTSCQRILFWTDYPHAEAEKYWKRHFNRTWTNFGRFYEITGKEFLVNYLKGSHVKARD
jgi:dCMP deaminase